MILPLSGTTPDGSLDGSFATGGKIKTDIGSGTSDIAYAMCLDGGGRIILAGTSAGNFALARYGERLYAQQDANHNVTSLVNAASSVQERYLYDAYGTVTFLS